MSESLNRNSGSFPRRALAAALLAAFSGSAAAIEFEVGDGWQGAWNTTISVGSSWRAEGRDPKLFSKFDGQAVGLSGGLGGSNTDSGNLNYGKGDRFSTVAKVVSDVELKKGTMGGFIRVKAWYDQAAKDEGVPMGNQPNGYKAGQALSDNGFEPLAKFDGIALLDAYVYNTFQLTPDNPMQVRLGRQVINWGESLFIQGVNQTNPLDATAFRRPGTEIKEVLLPVWSISGNLGLGGGKSLEAFYQFKWEPTVVDSCGTFWAMTETVISTSAGGCPMATSLSLTSSNRDAFVFNPANPAVYGTYVPLVDGKKPKDSGQFGVAFHFQLEPIDTEFGLYAMQIHSRTPIISGYAGQYSIPSSSLPPGSPLNPLYIHSVAIPGTTPAKAFWEYPEDVKLFGVSAATNFGGWSMASELSYSPNFPAQRNANDLLYALLTGYGPVGFAVPGAMADKAAGGPGYVSGYDRFHKTQLQANAVKLFSDVLGARTAQVVAEIGFQWNNVPDASSGLRYGRAFIFGIGDSPTYPPTALGSSVCNPPPGALQLFKNPQPDGCKNDGYVTKFAWGYRFRGQLEYGNVGNTGVNVTPSLYWAHDVQGYSIDGQFIEDRKQLGLGLRLTYLRQYNLDLNYVTYGNDAKFDQFRDHDFYSIAFSTTF